MAKIKITDLSQDMEISKEELRRIIGGMNSFLGPAQKLNRLLSVSPACVDYIIMLALKHRQEGQTKDKYP